MGCLIVCTSRECSVSWCFELVHFQQMVNAEISGCKASAKPPELVWKELGA